MRTHIINGGVVVNTIMATIEEANAAFPDATCVDGSVGGIGWTWDGARLSPPAQPAPDIDALRAAKNDEINAERERRTFDTFEHAGKTISCDTLSRSDIDGINGYVALNGVFPDIWPGSWKCADNSYLPITTVDEWKAFYGSMVAAGSVLYAHAQELKAALALAKTAEEVAAVVW